jgi:hypothetical protein
MTVNMAMYEYIPQQSNCFARNSMSCCYDNYKPHRNGSELSTPFHEWLSASCKCFVGLSDRQPPEVEVSFIAPL